MDATRIDNAVEKKVVLLVTTLGAFLQPFGVSSVNIALPTIGKEFGMDAILLSWVTTGYILASAIFLVPFGKIADIYGRKKIFSFGVLIITLASAGSAVSNSSAMLIGFRILQGIGAAANYCVGAAILTSVYPSKEMGKVLGINVAAVYLGHSLGPFIGGYLTQHYGWRTIFLISVFLGLMINFLIILKMKGEWREAKEEKLDLTGAIIYSVTLLFIMYGFTQLSAMLGVWLILLGVLGIFIFTKWEAKVKSPVLDINLFKSSRVFAFSNLAALINYSSTYAITFLLSLYLQYIKGLSPKTAGLILICLPVMQSSFSIISGKLSDRIEPRIVASMGMSLITVGLFLFTFLSEKTAMGFIVTNLILLGIGYALFISPNIKAVMSSVESKFYGMASGTHGTMRANGMIFSMGMTILIFSIYIGSVQITPEYYPPFLKCLRILFTLFTGLCLGGIIISLAGRKVR